MKEISLTQGKVAKVSNADYESLAEIKWCAVCWNNDSDSPDFYAYSGKYGSMHRYITKAPKGMHVDHINHDTLDNRRENLRVVSAQENRSNRRPTNRKRGRPVTTGATPRWSLRLDDETRKLLDLLAEQMQRSRASVIKVLIRAAATQSVIPPPAPQKKTAATKSAAARG